MSIRSKSLLFLLRRCAAARQLQRVTNLSSGAGFTQQRTWTSVTRRGCEHRLCGVQPAVEIGQFSFCNKAESSVEEEYPPLPAYQSDEPEKKEVFIVQVKGLPWSCTAQDIMEFFSECRIRDGLNGIHLTVDRLGRPSGRAFIEMEHRDDVSKALEQHRQYLGERYVEVFEMTKGDAETILKKALEAAADDSAVVRLRGLSFTCTEDDIVQFFTGLDIVENGITFVTDFTGKKSGEAFVEFSSQQEADKALQKDREFIGNRYIKVFRSKGDETNSSDSQMKKTLGSAQNSPQSANTNVSDPDTESLKNFDTRLHDTYLRDSFSKATSQEVEESDLSSSSDDEEFTTPPVQQTVESEKKITEKFFVRVRGLPWSCSQEELMNFFSDCKICDGRNGIHLILNRRGRPSGLGFVQMESKEDVWKALKKHRQYIGERYIEVFEMTDGDAEVLLREIIEPRAQSDVVRLRGLPYTCNDADIVQFFTGLDIVENGITFVTDFMGRKSGEAFVQFSSHQEAEEALQKDREFIGNRFVKVFPSTSDEIHPNWRMRTNMASARANHQPVFSRQPGSPQSSKTSFNFHQSGSPSAQASEYHDVKTETSHRDEYTPSGVDPSVAEHKRDVFIVQVIGLPWSCSAEDLMQFFSDCRIRDGLNGIHMTMDRRGRRSGQAFIEMQDGEDVSRALKKHREYIGERYVEVYEVTNSDAEAMLEKGLKPAADSTVVRLRGLPFSCTKEDIVQFFAGLNIVENGISFIPNNRGRPLEAYVQFLSQRDADEALQRDREFMGNRYIEVFNASNADINAGWKSRMNSDFPQRHSQRTNRTPPIQTGSPPNMLHSVHMRGLPFNTSAEDIVKFFSPLTVSSILIECGANGRPNGEADVHFESHQEAVAAMSKDKNYIGERFIELFLNSIQNCR